MARHVGDDYYLGAAVCRRGHTDTIDLEPGSFNSTGKACPTCGAAMLVACPQCSLRIRGYHRRPFGYSYAVDRPSFCDGCGAAFPWASRQERIYELENLLDQEDIDEADRVVIHDHLERLAAEELDQKAEKAAWRAIAERAGSALKTGHVQRVLEGVVSALIRRELGL